MYRWWHACTCMCRGHHTCTDDVIHVQMMSYMNIWCHTCTNDVIHVHARRAPALMATSRMFLIIHRSMTVQPPTRTGSYTRVYSCGIPLHTQSHTIWYFLTFQWVHSVASCHDARCGGRGDKTEQRPAGRPHPWPHPPPSACHPLTLDRDHPLQTLWLHKPAEEMVICVQLVIIARH